MDKNLMNILINERKGHYTQLKKLITAMDLIPGLDKDQFDLLTERILQQLENGSTEKKISQIVQSDLCSFYGLFSHEFDSEEIASKIMNWWENR